MRTLLCLLLALPSCAAEPRTQTDKGEAKAAFAYLNRVRKDPGKFSREIGADLRDVEKRDALTWSPELVKAAEAKAIDMAKRGYFGHVNPDGFGMNHFIHEAGYELPEGQRRSKEQNSFESISAGRSSGTEAVRMLILDVKTPDLGHRVHLLGTSEFSAKNTDCGVGFVRASGAKYPTYVVVLIAHQEKR